MLSKHVEAPLQAKDATQKQKHIAPGFLSKGTKTHSQLALRGQATGTAKSGKTRQEPHACIVSLAGSHRS